MKTFKIILGVAALLLQTSGALACDACNNKLKNELLTTRKGTLLSNELLLAMNNQKPLPAPSLENTSGGSKIDFPGIVNRDAQLSIPPTSYVPQDAKADVTCTISLEEGDTYIGNGVVYHGFTINKKIPGPTFTATEGDIVEFVVENKGKLPHGASLHMAYTQTSKHLGKIPPGETKSFKFKVSYAGVYMYHCAPGGHAIPMHIIYGQYGMMVVKPQKKYAMEEVMGKKPDVEIYLLQHEYYASGKDAVEGQGKPMYTAFNGKTFRYVEEPIKAKPGDFVRIYYLNAGPNLLATFHIVGIIWDYAYWQGIPENVFKGGQSVTAGPADSWVVDFRMPPDEGSYLMLSHAVGSTDRGAIGILQCDKNAKTPLTVLADGPEYSEKEMQEIVSKAKRNISPFQPGSLDVDPFVEYGPETKEVTVKIIGNSFYPKRIKIANGTTVKWVNEDVFSYLEGEFSGVHNTVGIDGPEAWASPLLTHAETFSREFTAEGKYEYVCMPHPYMKGEIEVVPASGKAIASAGPGTSITDSNIFWILIICTAFFFVVLFALSGAIKALAEEIKRRKGAIAA